MARGPYAAIAAAIVAVSTASILIRWSDSDAFRIAVADLGVSTTTLGGDVAALGGGVMAGIYFLAGRRLRQRVSLPVYAFVVYGSAAVALFVLAAATGKLAPAGDLRRELLLFGAMAIVPQIGGHTLYNWALRYVPAPLVSVSLVGEPIGSSILAWLLLTELPSALVAIGALLALSGIFLTAYSTATTLSKTPA